MKQPIRITGLMATMVLVASASAQSKYGATPEDSVTCVQNLSLYQEFMKQDAVKDAYGPWKEVLRVCPGASKGAYQNGAQTILPTLIANEKDEVRKKRLIDSLYITYDMRAANFGEDDFVMGRKGADMLVYSPERDQEAFDILHNAVEGGKERSEAGTLSADYQALNILYNKEKATKDQMMAEYVFLMGFIDAKLANPALKERDRDYIMQARDNVNTLFFKIAECADIGRIVGDMLEADPDDMELKVRLLKVLNGKDCTDDPAYLPLAKAVHANSPTSESAFSLAMSLVKDRDMTGAAKYMKEAVDLCDGCPDKVKYLLKAGQVASANGNHGLARSYANQVLQIEPKNGEALMLIGNAVAANASACQPPDSWAVYWLAYDYYQRAKSLDPSVNEKASERMASSAARFPTQSDAFFYQLSEGQSVQVACGGLNESTTVRFRK
jgi:tetratricopeptide (TPR) repeat protein